MQRPPLLAILAGVFLVVIGIVAVAAPAMGIWQSQPQAQAAADTTPEVSAAEARAWAEARAADTPAAYRVYLAAYPDGAFKADAEEELGGTAAPAQTAAAAPRQISAAPAPRGPSRAEIASSCQAYVDANWPAPSRLARVGGGAAAGCGVGALAGGDDGRNCAIGAVAGGVTGEVTVRTRQRRRETELASCIDRGGP